MSAFIIQHLLLGALNLNMLHTVHTEMQYMH